MYVPLCSFTFLHIGVRDIVTIIIIISVCPISMTLDPIQIRRKDKDGSTEQWQWATITKIRKRKRKRRRRRNRNERKRSNRTIRRPFVSIGRRLIWAIKTNIGKTVDNGSCASMFLFFYFFSSLSIV